MTLCMKHLIQRGSLPIVPARAVACLVVISMSRDLSDCKPNANGVKLRIRFLHVLADSGMLQLFVMHNMAKDQESFSVDVYLSRVC